MIDRSEDSEDDPFTITTIFVVIFLILETMAAVLGTIILLFVTVAMSNLSGFPIWEAWPIFVVIALMTLSCASAWWIFSRNDRSWWSVIAGLFGALIVPVFGLVTG